MGRCQTLTANFKGKIRRVSYKGRDYLVAPMRMIVPGVLSGNKGPILYVPEENSKSRDLWNYMPIVVNHPFRPDGRAGSAKDKGVLRQTGIGFVANTRDGKFLDAEGWFDIEKTKKVDYRIFTNLVAKRPIELSTGLFMDYEPATPGAVHNGVPYKYIARNYRPDHLAVLPDEEGACSLRDGCGVLVNSKLSLIQRVKNIIFNYNPSQPRDDQGQWSSGGGSGSAAARGGKGGSKPSPGSLGALAGKSSKYANSTAPGTAEFKKAHEQAAQDHMDAAEAYGAVGESGNQALHEMEAESHKLHAEQPVKETPKPVKKQKPVKEKKLVDREYSKLADEIDREDEEIASLMKPGFSTQKDAMTYAERKAHMDEMLDYISKRNAGRLPEQLAKRRPTTNSLLSRVTAIVDNYNPSQPRDNQGRWSSGGGSGSSSSGKSGGAGGDLESKKAAWRQQLEDEAKAEGFKDHAAKRDSEIAAEKAGVDPDAAVSTKKILDGGFGVDTSKTPSFEELQKRQSDMFAREDAAKKAKHEASYQETQQQLSETIKRVEAREAAADSKANVRAEAMSELIKEKGSVRDVTAKDLKERIQQKASGVTPPAKGKRKGGKGGPTTNKALVSRVNNVLETEMPASRSLIRRVAAIVANYSPNQPRGNDGRWSSGGSGGGGKSSGKGAAKSGQAKKSGGATEKAQKEIASIVSDFEMEYAEIEKNGQPQLSGYATKPVSVIHTEIKAAGFAQQPNGLGEDFTRFKNGQGHEVLVDKYQSETLGHPKGTYGVQYHPKYT